MEFMENSMEFNGIPLNFPWNSMEFHGIFHVDAIHAKINETKQCK
jgi:hypothetical protein